MKSKLLLPLSLALAATVAVSAKVTEKFSQTYPLDPSGTISVSNVNGTVEIVAWDKPEVALEAEKSAKDQDALSRIELKIDAAPQSLRVKTVYEKRWKFWDNAQASVHYKLMVPAGATLDKIDVVNANIHVTGVKGRVNLDTVNGSISASGLTGSGRFDTVNGSIEVGYAALPAAGEVSLDTVNGSCALKLPANAAFRLDADTVNGHIGCDFPITLESSGKHSLRGTVNGGGITVKLDSVNGGLKVTKAN